MADKQDFLPDQGTRPRSGALDQLVHGFLEDLELQGRSPLTVEHYAADIDVFRSWLASETGRAAADLSPDDIDDGRVHRFQLYLARRRDRRTGKLLSAPTRNRYAASLSGLLRYGRRRRGLALPDPESAVTRARERDVAVRHLTREEVKRLREAADPATPTGLRDRALVEALFGSGARVSELAAMTVRGFDPVRREVEVVGKGSKSRIVFLTEEAAGWIERYLATRRDDCRALFATVKGVRRPLSVRQIERIVSSLALRARLPFAVSPHWLRHSRLTIVARHSGVEAAQKVAGHSSLQTTARYLHVTDAHLRSLYDQAEDLDRAQDR